jgi:predicted ArsR family transcriptional regulator
MSGEDHVTRVHRALGAPRRAEILRLLQEADHPLAIQDVVDATSLHPNTVRNHLERLARAGLVRQLTEDRSAPGRPRSLFTAGGEVGAGDLENSTDDSGYRDLTGILAASLRQAGNPAAHAVITGQQWLRTLAVHDWPARPAPVPTALSDVVVLLDEMGLSPTLADDGSTVAIDVPNSADLSADDMAVLLSVHAGMLERALERLDCAMTIASVDPLDADRPTTYLIQLRPTSGERDTGRISLPVLARPAKAPANPRAQRRPA